MQYERGLSIVSGQITIARAHGQAVPIANNRADDQPKVEIQVPHHAMNDDRLLKILLAEVSNVSTHDVK